MTQPSSRSRTALVATTIASALVVPGGLTVGVPYLLATRADVGTLAALLQLPVGVAALAAGLVALVWCSVDFIVVGGGTPNPADPPRHLVARGPYAVVRNPMYAAMTLIVAGEAVLWPSTALAAYLALLLLAFHLFVTAYEEPRLRRRFGASYEEYCARVPRWLPTFAPAAEGRP